MIQDLTVNQSIDRSNENYVAIMNYLLGLRKFDRQIVGKIISNPKNEKIIDLV